jgi:hypothetical protein
VARRGHRDDQDERTRRRRRVPSDRCRSRCRRIDADVEITEFVPGQRIAFRITKGPVRPMGSYDLRAGEGGTVVTFRLAATLGGAKKLMAPMVAKTMRSEVAALTELKRVLESRS